MGRHTQLSSSPTSSAALPQRTRATNNSLSPQIFAHSFVSQQKYRDMVKADGTLCDVGECIYYLATHYRPESRPPHPQPLVRLFACTYSLFPTDELCPSSTPRRWTFRLSYWNVMWLSVCCSTSAPQLGPTYLRSYSNTTVPISYYLHIIHRAFGLLSPMEACIRPIV